MSRPREMGEHKRENSAWCFLPFVSDLEQKFLLAFDSVEQQLCHTYEHMGLSRHYCHTTVLSEFK